MKSFISSIVLLAVLVFFSIVHSHTLNKITSSLILQNNTIIENIYSENYNEALIYLNEFDRYVNSKRTILSTSLDHSILTKIDEYIAQIRGYISESSKTDAIAVSFALSTFIENIPQNYKLKIDNIL